VHNCAQCINKFYSCFYGKQPSRFLLAMLNAYCPSFSYASASLGAYCRTMRYTGHCIVFTSVDGTILRFDPLPELSGRYNSPASSLLLATCSLRVSRSCDEEDIAFTSTVPTDNLWRTRWEYHRKVIFNLFFFCSRTTSPPPWWNFSSTLYSQSCWCII
jgi:hypothetical protein